MNELHHSSVKQQSMAERCVAKTEPLSHPSLPMSGRLSLPLAPWVIVCQLNEKGKYNGGMEEKEGELLIKAEEGEIVQCVCVSMCVCVCAC